MDFSGHASHATAIVIDDVIIIGKRRVYCASTLLGRCVCKRVDVYIMTLLCTWQICALFERLLVIIIDGFVFRQLTIPQQRHLVSLLLYFYYQFSGHVEQSQLCISVYTVTFE